MRTLNVSALVDCMGTSMQTPEQEYEAIKRDIEENLYRKVELKVDVQPHHLQRCDKADAQLIKDQRAYEVRNDKYHKSPIPVMDHPLSKHWDQPLRGDILVDDYYAILDLKAYDALHSYDCSLPSGVYPGKMWKRNCGVFRVLLCWYGLIEDGVCRVLTREIIEVVA